jgi:hypothetical protein
MGVFEKGAANFLLKPMLKHTYLYFVYNLKLNLAIWQGSAFF